MVNPRKDWFPEKNNEGSIVFWETDFLQGKKCSKNPAAHKECLN